LTAVLLVACGCNRAGNAGKPDADLYSYVPPDSTFIAGARFSSLRTKPLYQKLLERMPQEMRPYEKQASEMVIASDGMSMLILARGKFDKKQLERDLKDTTVTYLSDDLIAVAPPGRIEIAKRRAGSALGKSIPGDGEIWMVTNGNLPIPIPERSNLNNLSRIAQDLTLARLNLHVNDGIRGEFDADFRTEKAAEQMNTAVRGFMGLARLSAPQGKPELLRALDAMQTKYEAKHFQLTADWSADLVDVLLRSLPQR